MELPVTFKVNLFNQYVNNSLWGCKLIIKWDDRKRVWFLYNPKKSSENYYFKVAILKLVVILAGAASLLVQNVSKSMNSKVIVFLFAMETTLIVITLLLDVVCYANIAEVLHCSNWTNRQFNKGSRSIKLEAGILSLVFLIGYVIVAVVLNFCIVYCDLDPLYILCLLQNYLFPSLKISNLLILCRYIYFGWFTQVCASGFRTVSICALVGGFCRGKYLFWLSKQKFKVPLIRFYCQNYVVQAAMNSFEFKASSAIFSVAFGVITFGTYVTLVGQNIGFKTLSVVGLVGIGLGIAVLQCFFMVGCAYFNNSLNVLHKWKKDLSLRGSCLYLRKKLKSLRPIAMPAGGVGIIDNDIKINYFYNLLAYVVNVILSTKNIT